MEVAFNDVEMALPHYLQMAEEQPVVITREDRHVGILIGFQSEEDWQVFQLENDPRFLQRIQSARQNIKSGGGVRLEDITL
jgi:PHD/YefM family antitoxin component YafN of YafNO toxin-antitoxin module